MYHPADPRWMRDELAPFFESDVGIIAFEVLRGSLCTFPTHLGNVGTLDNQWNSAWIDPLQVALDLAHEHGLRLFAGLRMIGAGYPVVRNPIQWAGAYWAHQEWAVRDRDGLPCSNLSLAFPEVRRYWLDLLREALAYGADGVQLLLHRSHPFVMYEAPVLAEFQAAYGFDPRTLPDDDPLWLAQRAGYVTQFLREVRALLDEQPGRELRVTFLAQTQPLRYACDVETWLREELVDYLMPTPSVASADIQRWRALGGTRVHIHPDLEPRTQPGDAYVALAQAFYAAGADGLHLWNAERRAPRASEWAVVRRLGHRDLLDQLATVAPTYWRRVPLKQLGGVSIRYSHNDG